MGHVQLKTVTVFGRKAVDGTSLAAVKSSSVAQSTYLVESKRFTFFFITSTTHTTSYIAVFKHTDCQAHGLYTTVTIELNWINVHGGWQGAAVALVLSP